MNTANIKLRIASVAQVIFLAGSGLAGFEVLPDFSEEKKLVTVQVLDRNVSSFLCATPRINQT